MSSIEALKVGDDEAWAVIAQSAHLIKRQQSAVVILSETKIAIFGGAGKKDGYILELTSNSLSPILGGQEDEKFKCFTLA